MKLPTVLLTALRRKAHAIMASRAPDFIIGENYLVRWFAIPRNPVLNIYLHLINKSDDDRALHDHPWVNCSIVVSGRYLENTISAGGIHRKTLRASGSITLRRATAAHRLEVIDGEQAISFFVTGPRFRQWGFHCPQVGWRHWQDFTSPNDSSQTGRGCGE